MHIQLWLFIIFHLDLNLHVNPLMLTERSQETDLVSSVSPWTSFISISLLIGQHLCSLPFYLIYIICLQRLYADLVGEFLSLYQPAQGQKTFPPISRLYKFLEIRQIISRHGNSVLISNYF